MNAINIILNISFQHRYDEILEWYTNLASNNPDVMRFVPSIGKSVEGRDQPAVHITDGWQTKDKVYFQCQIHASKAARVSPALS